MKFPRAQHAGASGGNGSGQSYPVGWMLAGQGQEICVRHRTRKHPPRKKTMGIRDRFCSHEPEGGSWSEVGGGGGAGGEEEAEIDPDLQPLVIGRRFTSEPKTRQIRCQSGILED